MTITARYFENVCTVDTSGRVRNLELVLKRGLEVCGQKPARDGRLAIVGSGPSVREYLDEIFEVDEIWAINGAYDYLQDQSIVADGFIGIDPLPGLVEYVRQPLSGTTFYIASVCDPGVFDALEGQNVKIWHSGAHDQTYPAGQKVVIGGTTAMTRAPFLALMCGWRDITLYGADSSYAEDGSEYCYQWGTYAHDIAQPKMEVLVNGEGPFLTEVGLLKQVTVLNIMHEKFRGMLKFRCGGLMEAYLRAPVRDDLEIEIETDGQSEGGGVPSMVSATEARSGLSTADNSKLVEPRGDACEGVGQTRRVV